MKTKNHDFINICGEWINLNEVRKIVVYKQEIMVTFIDGKDYRISPDGEYASDKVAQMLNKRLDKLM